MNLQLLITKKEYAHYNNRTRTKHLFAVIDLDESKQYPQNFVSVLPLHIRAIVKPSNVFEGLSTATTNSLASSAPAAWSRSYREASP